MAVERLPPSNVEAEEAVLGSLLIDPEAILRVASFLVPDYFYREKNGWIYEAIRDLYERREPPDFLTVCDELERRGRLEEVGGPGYLTALINAVPTAIHAEHYAHIVERTALRRRLISAAGDIARIAYEDTEEVDETIDRAEEILFSVAQQRLTRYLIPIRRLLGDYFDQIEYLHEHQGELSGVPSGFADLDKILGGLQQSDLIIIAGRPGMGKTSLVLSIAQNMAIHHKDLGAIAIFSLEMGAEQVAQRLISSETGIDSQRLRLGRVRDDEIDEIVRAIGRLSETAIFIDDTPAISSLELRTKARRLHAERPIGLIIVDYLQLMQAGRRTENRVQEISLISRSLKGLARELKVPVIAASQLSRAVESRADKHPILSDLRESGCLTGDTLVYLPDNGRYIPIWKLVGQNGFRVMSLNTQTWEMERGTVARVFCTGVKPVYRLTTRLGRTVRATANHKFLTIRGWKRLDELTENDRIALPRFLDGPSEQTMTDAELARKPQSKNITRQRAAALAEAIKSDVIARLADSDVYWDRIKSIEAGTEEQVFDLTVSGLHNFIANDIYLHNSIEQDADVVMFIYRDEMYNEDTMLKNIAEISVAKHRNGPVGKVELAFIAEQAKFMSLYREPA